MDCKRLCASLSWESQSFNYSTLHNLFYSSQSMEFKQWIKLFSGVEEYWQNKKWLQKLENEHLWLEKRGVRLLAPWEKEYPQVLKELASPPFLSILGDLKVLSSPSMAVVGSRNPSSMSINWLRSEFSEFLLKNQVTVISGGARGIDQEAHRICMSRKTPTICFLPSGLAKVYPAEIVKWFELIVLQGGAIVSQFSPFTRIYKSNFHRRNELIVALSKATFVVEAKQRSGSLMTATKTVKWGKEVATLPSHPNSPTGRGSIQLLTEGAQMLVDAQDLNIFWQRNNLG